jgi:hypothetical protein
MEHRSSVFVFYTEKGDHMQSDGYLVTKQPQPLHLWSWPAAAKYFLRTKREFLHEDSLNNIVGVWSICCFPFKGATNKPVSSFSPGEIRRMHGLIIQARMVAATTEFGTVSLIEQFFQANLEYPPYSLDDNWDGRAMRRRHWAELLFQKKFLIIS